MQVRESAGGVIVNTEGNIVLVEQHSNSWTFPKGGVEQGETLLAAALREVCEETGLTKLELIEELGSYERKSIGPGGVGETEEWGSRKRTFFLFKTIETTIAPIHDPDNEITQARWVSVAEALALLTHPRDREFLESVQNKLQ